MNAPYKEVMEQKLVLLARKRVEAQQNAELEANAHAREQEAGRYR